MYGQVYTIDSPAEAPLDLPIIRPWELDFEPNLNPNNEPSTSNSNQEPTSTTRPYKTRTYALPSDPNSVTSKNPPIPLYPKVDRKWLNQQLSYSCGLLTCENQETRYPDIVSLKYNHKSCTEFGSKNSCWVWCKQCGDKYSNTSSAKGHLLRIHLQIKYWRCYQYGYNCEYEGFSKRDTTRHQEICGLTPRRPRYSVPGDGEGSHGPIFMQNPQTMLTEIFMQNEL